MSNYKTPDLKNLQGLTHLLQHSRYPDQYRFLHFRCNVQFMTQVSEEKLGYLHKLKFPVYTTLRLFAITYTLKFNQILLEILCTRYERLYRNPL